MNEPTRKNFFHLLKSNMAAADKTQFITRLVYFGSYQGTEDYLQKNFEIVINYLRSEFPDNRITGLLLVYPQYFLHIIETSEELIFRHLDEIFNGKENNINLGRVLPLPPYHHVYHCFFPKWLKVFTKSPELLDKLETSGLPEVEKQLNNCLTKVYTLCEYILSNTRGIPKTVEEVLKKLCNFDKKYLPEVTILEFLLKSKCPILRDLREYVEMAPLVPHLKLYNENIWPPPCDFLPREVFVEHDSRRDLILRRFSQQQKKQQNQEESNMEIK